MRSVSPPAKSIDEAYSSQPWWYDFRGFLILKFSYRTSLLAQIRMFSQNIGGSHLEIAIGSGTLFDLILKWRSFKKMPQANITGFDYAERMLAGAKKRFASFQNIQLIKADAAKLPLEDESFDSANIANAIHCLPDILGSLREVHRVLKPAGRLAGNCLLYPRGKGVLDQLAVAINNWGMKVGILNRPYLESEIRTLLIQSGFEIQTEYIHGNCYNFIAKKSEPSKTRSLKVLS